MLQLTISSLFSLFSQTKTLPEITNPFFRNKTSIPLETIKPQSIDLSIENTPKRNRRSPPPELSPSIPVNSITNETTNTSISAILLPIIDLFGTAVQRAAPSNPGSAPNPLGLNETAAAMQQQLADNIAQMQALQRSLESDPQAASRVACDMATIIRAASGFTSPTALYSSLVSGRQSGIAGGSPLAQVLAATNAGSTFSDSCSKIDPSHGSLSSAVNDLLGPNNNTPFSQSLVSLSSYIDSTSVPSATRVSSLVPAYLSGTSLGNTLATIESGIMSANLLARYNATQLFSQIVSRFGSSLLGGTASASEKDGQSILNGMQMFGLFGNGAGSKLLTDLQKLLQQLGGGGLASSSSPALGSLTSAFTNGFSNALSGRRKMKESHLTFL